MTEYIECNECNGTGRLPDQIHGNVTFTNCICKKCQGVGKLDWIENVVGKKRNIHEIDAGLYADFLMSKHLNSGDIVFLDHDGKVTNVMPTKNGEIVNMIGIVTNTKDDKATVLLKGRHKDLII